MKLIAEIIDEELLFKLVHQLGATFFRTVGEGIVEVVYFSGEKVVHYQGKVTEEHFKLLNATGWPVNSIEVSQVEGTVKIKQ